MKASADHETKRIVYQIKTILVTILHSSYNVHHSNTVCPKKSLVAVVYVHCIVLFCFHAVPLGRETLVTRTSMAQIGIGWVVEPKYSQKVKRKHAMQEQRPPLILTR